MNNDGTTYATRFQTAHRLVNTDKLKQEISDRISLSEVAEQLCDVELHSAGQQKKGLCPVHGEDTPSFYVNDGKGLWHCHGCKAGGDSIQLVREVHNVGFREALVMLAGAAGVEIEKYERPLTDDEKEQERLRQWCENWLNGLDWDGSRVSLDVAIQYGARIPMTPKGPRPAALKEKDYLFRGEVVFPYRTSHGRLVGWKVREPDKKMFGTPNDFPLAEPVIFGLDVARPHIEQGKLYMVEGEYDCMVLYDHGIHNVAAIGGSRFTDEQMELLIEHKIREVVFLFDGDEGGRTGAEGVAKRYWQHPDIDVKIALAPAGADPEDYIRAMGSIENLEQQARGALEWLLHQEFSSKPRRSLTDRMDFVRWVRKEYGAQLTGMAETLVLKEIAVWLGVPEADILDFAQADKTMLQAPDSEKVVIGRCMRDQRYYLATRKRMIREDFWVTKHKRIWTVLETLLADGLDFDPATIRKRAEGQGVEPGYVDILLETGDMNIGFHEDTIIDYSVRRSARADADYFREVISDLNVPANQLIGTLTHQITSKALGRATGAFRGIQEQVDEAMDKLHARMKDPDSISGLDVGSQFPTLMANLDGFQARRLVLVAATSGRGKSTLTLQWVTSLALQQVPCDFISLEMDTDEILYKQVSHMTGIDSLRVSKGALEPDELKRVEQAMARLRMSPLRIYAPDGITPNEFLLYAREAVMERRTEVFVVDYAQMVGPDSDTARLSRYEQLGRFAYTAKQKVCRGLDTTVIACAQLKREAATKEEPTPEDMGDSYELVRASDVIIILNENESQQSETWIGKNRQGPGQVLIPSHYDKPMNTFNEQHGPKEPDYRL